MTSQERELLGSLTNRIVNTAVPQKDPEAEALIRQKLGAKQDALYVLTQTVLIQEMALNQANARMHELEQQLETQRGAQPAQQPTSFLGRLFGSGASQAAPPPPNQYAPSYGQPQYQQGPYQQPPGQGPSFLRSAAATATGVAAGALAFEGIESLFGHHGGGGLFGGGSEERSFLDNGPSETIINNYYDSPSDDSSTDVDTSFDSANGDASDDYTSTDV